MFELIFHSLIVWRVAYMITEEDGPKDIFRKLQSYGKPFNCFSCLSVIIALILAFCIKDGFLYGLALAGLAKLINGLYEYMTNVLQ